MVKLRKPLAGFLVLGFALILVGGWVISGSVAAEDPAAGSQAGIELDVYKSPTCGCCGKWIEHLNKYGAQSAVHHPSNLAAIKQQHNIAPRYRSCHTAVSDQGYVFEGHVPAKLVQQFLAAPPKDAIGLAVPGMPAGSPGMEMGVRFDAYQVLLLKKDGSAEVYANIRQPGMQY